jgi:hypothetical protein
LLLPPAVGIAAAAADGVDGAAAAAAARLLAPPVEQTLNQPSLASRPEGSLASRRSKGLSGLQLTRSDLMASKQVAQVNSMLVQFT